jgi:hypothetical protein
LATKIFERSGQNRLSVIPPLATNSWFFQ